MAGNYMDAPNDRAAWDRDGSILTLITTGNAVTAVNATDRRTVNSEDETGIVALVHKVAIVFPVPMDCSAMFLALGGPRPWNWTVAVETSKDTTNGVDGTWSTQYLTGLNPWRATKPEYREAASLYTFQTNAQSSDLKGVRFAVYSNLAGTAAATLKSDNLLRAFHIYGQPSTLATKDRLAIWQPTTDAKVTPTWFDWGDVARGSSADKTFRVKNLSTVLTASDIDVYVEALTPGSPSVAGMHLISANLGSTFLTQVNIVSLAPGVISPVLTLRRTVPITAQVSVWSARVAADVNVWI